MDNKSSKSTSDRLAEANRKIDEQLPDIWLQAERNLEKLEEEYHNNHINKEIRD